MKWAEPSILSLNKPLEGKDILYTPTIISYALISMDKSYLFIDCNAGKAFCPFHVITSYCHPARPQIRQTHALSDKVKSFLIYPHLWQVLLLG